MSIDDPNADREDHLRRWTCPWCQRTMNAQARWRHLEDRDCTD